LQVVQYLVDDCLILNAGNHLGFAATLRATRHVNVEHPLQFMMTFAALHPQESMLQTGVFKVIGKYLLFLIELWEEQQMTIFLSPTIWKRLPFSVSVCWRCTNTIRMIGVIVQMLIAVPRSLQITHCLAT
jgi:hypothetical protein